MPEEICGFSLILPAWLCWPFIIVGLISLALALWRLFFSSSTGTFAGGWKATFGNIHPSLLWITGAAASILGLLLLMGSSYQPFALWVGDHFSLLIYEADQPVTADLNGRPLGDVTGTFRNGERYTVTVAQDARSVQISGSFDARCSADLMVQICRHERQTLSCDIDPQARIVRVCAKAKDAPCKERSL